MIRFLVVSLMLFAGCTVRQPLPTLVGAPIGGALLSEFEQEVAERSSEIRSYRALNRMTIIHDGEQTSFRQIVLFEHPGKLRLETLPIGASYALNLLAVQAGQVIYLDAQNKRAVVGAESVATLSEILPLPLLASDLAALLSGTLPTSILADTTEAAVYLDSERRQAQILSKNYEQYYQISLLDSTVRLAEFRRAHKIIARVILDEFTLVSDLSIPGTIVIELPQDKVRIELRMVRLEINPKLAQNLFEAKIPGDFKKEVLR